MNILLNVFGIGFVLYAVILFMKSSNSNESKLEKNLKEDKVEQFDADKFIEEVNSFSKVLNDKTDDMKKDNINTMNEDMFTPSKKIEREMDKKQDPGYTSLVKDISKNRKSTNIGSSNNEIISLKDIGLSEKEIAKRTGRSIREVEVVLKVYNKK